MMDWVLFLQIEIILLTVGFMVLTTISHYQNVKDDSRKERWRMLASTLVQFASKIAEKTKDTQDLEKALDSLLKKYSSGTTEKKE